MRSSSNLKTDTFAQPSIDIEASIRNGALDVGLFAPRNLLDVGGAHALLNELRDVLTGVLESCT